MGLNEFGIDLGTCNTLIYRRDKGVVLNEPSILATETYGAKKFICAGREARDMMGRTPDTVTVTQPVQNGVIADFDKTVMMLKDYLRRCRTGFGPVSAVVSIPCRATPVEKRAVADAVRAAGVKKVPFVVEKPIAAALGSGLSIFEPRGRMVVDMGGGTTEISVLSMGGIVSVTSTTCAGKKFDRDIISYVRKTHSVLIGDRTAEDVKMSIGSVFDDGHVNFITVSGRDLVRGLPVNVSLSTDDVREVLAESSRFLVDQIKQTLEKIPPEMAADIIDSGITLVGGGSLLPGWEELLSKETGVACMHSASPLESVVTGVGNAFRYRDQIKHGVQHENILA